MTTDGKFSSKKKVLNCGLLLGSNSPGCPQIKTFQTQKYSQMMMLSSQPTMQDRWRSMKISAIWGRRSCPSYTATSWQGGHHIPAG